MKPQVSTILALLSFTAPAVVQAQEKPDVLPALTGPYLGQTPPAGEARTFAFEILDPNYGSFHSSVVFSSDGNSAYWQTGLNDGSRLQAIFETTYVDRNWTRPRAAFFSALTPGGTDDAPFISPDGNRFFFLSCRPIAGGNGCGKWNIWVMERVENKWSEPRALSPVVNSLEGIHWQLSADYAGNLFFGTWRRQADGERNGEIHVSRYEAGTYTEPQKLGPEINMPGRYNRSPFIAPDGSYLLFNRNDDTTTARMFISFRDRGGAWTTPRDITGVLGRQGWNPIVTGDGRYLFFLATDRGKIRPFWMKAGFINELRESELDDRESR